MAQLTLLRENFIKMKRLTREKCEAGNNFDIAPRVLVYGGKCNQALVPINLQITTHFHLHTLSSFFLGIFSRLKVK